MSSSALPSHRRLGWLVLVASVALMSVQFALTPTVHAQSVTPHTISAPTVSFPSDPSIVGNTCSQPVTFASTISGGAPTVGTSYAVLNTQGQDTPVSYSYPGPIDTISNSLSFCYWLNLPATTPLRLFEFSTHPDECDTLRTLSNIGGTGYGLTVCGNGWSPNYYTYTPNTWFHACHTLNATRDNTIYTYINGRYHDSWTTPAAPTLASLSNSWFFSPLSTGSFSMDEIHYWNYQLSPAQILAGYTNNSWSSTNPQVYFDFSTTSASGADLLDQSGHGYHWTNFTNGSSFIQLANQQPVCTSATASYCPITYTYSEGNIGVVFTVNGTAADETPIAITSSTILSDSTGSVVYVNAGLPISDANGYTVEVATTDSSATSVPRTFIVAPVSNSVQVNYHGATSASTGDVYAFEANIAVSPNSPLLVNAGQLEFGRFSYYVDGAFYCDGEGGLSADGQLLEGSCAPFAVLPLPAGNYIITASYQFQVDPCHQFTGSVNIPLEIVDLSAQITARVSGDSTLAQQIQQETDARVQDESQIINVNIQQERIARIQADQGEVANLTAAIQVERVARTAGDAALNQTIHQLALSLQAQIDQLNQPSSFMFWGFSKSTSIAYPRGQNPAPTSYLNSVIKFDLPLTQVVNGLSYDSTTGFATFTKAGSYRLDAFIHLVDGTGSNGVGTGVVAWCPYNSFKPIGPNILNDQTRVAQGVSGDDSIISTLITIQPNELPKRIRLVLLTANQRTSIITDASTMSITQL